MKALCQKYEKEQSEIKGKMEALSLSEDGMGQHFMEEKDQKQWLQKTDDLIKSTLEKCLVMLQQLKRNTNKAVPDKDPEVLRAWLFSHFENPYPTPSDKEELAKQSGYTQKQVRPEGPSSRHSGAIEVAHKLFFPFAQVSNWFINARVRLWRPMILQTEKEIDQKKPPAKPKAPTKKKKKRT